MNKPEETKRCSRDIPPYHACPDVPEDFHHRVRIEANTNIEGPPGVPYLYWIWAGPGAPTAIYFQSKCINTPEDINGVTHEMLLAVCRDRIQHFQLTQFACTENETALHHLKEAMKALQDRTRRRHCQGVLNTHTPEAQKVNTQQEAGGEPATKTAGRITIIGSKIGFAIEPGEEVELIALDRLKEWGQWGQVESVVKRMVRKTGRLTEQELDLIRSCATTSGAKNGLAEFEQAYKQMQ